MAQSPPMIIGLTGNIACGKSTAAKLLVGLKTDHIKRVAVVDADQISAALLANDAEVQNQIRQAFGTIDREKIRNKIFSSERNRKKLEAILHPAIAKASRLAFEQLTKQGYDLIIYEASLLIEAGRANDFDGLLLITTTDEMQRLRLKNRNPNWSPEAIAGAIQSQQPQDEKAKLADWIIENTGSESELKTKLQAWLDSVRSRIPRNPDSK